MLTKDDIETIALLIARTNSHPAPAEYAAAMLNEFTNMPDVGDKYPGYEKLAVIAAPSVLLAGTPVLTDPTEWPAPVVAEVIPTPQDADSGL